MNFAGPEKLKMWAPLSDEASDIFGKGIFECMSRWTALQLAIQNGWGGQSSDQKCQQLYTDVFSFFTRSKEQRYIDEMEDLLDQFMLESFNCEIDDGSIFEVAEQLFIIHEECVNGNFDKVREMFATPSGSGAQKSKELPGPAEENPAGACGATSSDEEDEEDMDMEDSLPASAPTAPPSSSSSKLAKVVASKLTEEERADGWQEAGGRSRRNTTVR